jgi:hypothetical protein
LRPGTFLVRLNENQLSNLLQIPFGFISYIDVDSKVSSIPLYKIPQGVAIFLKEKYTEYPDVSSIIESNIEMFRYNFTPQGLPTLKFENVMNSSPYQVIQGPPDKLKPCSISFKNIAHGTSVSTYPETEGLWNIICDFFSFAYSPDKYIFCVTDGWFFIFFFLIFYFYVFFFHFIPIFFLFFSNWGNRPQKASEIANRTFLEYMMEMQSKCVDTHDIGHYILRSLDVCHKKIVEGYDNPTDAGTTTIINGMVIKLSNDEPGN